MAMYEREGFCPNNSFFWALSEMSDAKKAAEISRRFGDRMAYVVYAPGEVSDGYYCSIIEAIKCDQDFALRLADLLAELIPACKYAEYGRKIVLHDVVSSTQAAGEKLTKTDDGGFFFLDNGKLVKRKGSKYILETAYVKHDVWKIISEALRAGAIIDQKFVEKYPPTLRFLFVIDDKTDDDIVDIKICVVS